MHENYPIFIFSPSYYASVMKQNVNPVTGCVTKQETVI